MWELNGNPIEESLDDGGVATGAVRFLNQQPDVLQLQYPRNYTEAPVFAAGDAITLAWDGTVVFRGWAGVPSVDASGTVRAGILTAQGPWADLDRMVLQTNNCRLEYEEGETLEDIVEDIIDRAIMAGARLARGTIDLPHTPPTLIFDNLTYGEILRQALRWAVGSVAWFDYSHNPPQLNVKRPDQLTPGTISPVGLVRFGIAPRDDLRVAKVKLIYRTVEKSAFAENETTTIDQVGAGGDRGAYIAAIDMGPKIHDIAMSRATVTTISAGSLDWWVKKFPELAGIPGLGAPSSYAVSSALPREHVAGAVATWAFHTILGEENPNPHGCQVLADPPYGEVTDAESYATEIAEVSAIWFPDSPAPLRMTARIIATDMPAGDIALYREEPDNLIDAEEIPAGLASAILASAGPLPHQGGFTLQAVDTSRLGQRISFSGTAWDEIAAPIYAATITLQTRQTAYEFGPSGYLGPRDLIELLRAARNRKMKTITSHQPLEPVVAPMPSGAAPSPPEEGDAGNTGTVNINVTGLPDPNMSQWTVAGQSGAGDGSVQVAPGTHTVSFQPVIDTDTGKWYFSPSADVTVTDGGSTTANAVYDPAKRLVLEDIDNEKQIDLNTGDVPDEEGYKVVKVRQVPGMVDGATGSYWIPATDFKPDEESE